jgi:hypothetical protein
MNMPTTLIQPPPATLVKVLERPMGDADLRAEVERLERDNEKLRRRIAELEERRR